MLDETAIWSPVFLSQTDSVDSYTDMLRMPSWTKSGTLVILNLTKMCCVWRWRAWWADTPREETGERSEKQ